MLVKYWLPKLDKYSTFSMRLLQIWSEFMKTFLKHAASSFAFNKGAQETKRVCQPFLDRLGFENFYYARIKRNGELVFLTNHVKFAMEYWEDGRPLETGFDEPTPKIQSLAMTWNDIIDQSTLNFCADQGCYDGFSFIDRYHDTLLLASFMRSSPDDNVNDFYINHAQEMRCWVRNFERSNRHLINHAAQNPLVLPESYLSPQRHAFYPDRSIQLIYHGIKGKLTFRELDCLHLHGRGFTAPHIASLLELSPRTIQTHLEAVKSRFGLTSRNDLATLAYTSPLVQTYSPRICGEC